jgi:hypothetical protein
METSPWRPGEIGAPRAGPRARGHRDGTIPATNRASGASSSASRVASAARAIVAQPRRDPAEELVAQRVVRGRRCSRTRR